MRVSSRHFFSPIAPMPADPLTCRWCGHKRREILPPERCVLHGSHEGPHCFVTSDGIALIADDCKATKPGLTLCNSGCADNHDAPFVGHCVDCLHQFETGERHATHCHGCKRLLAEEARMIGASMPEKPGYHFSTFGRGSWRG